MLFARAFVIASALLGAACATVSARGIVRDQRGQPVPDASLTLTTRDGIAIVRTVSDPNGCINVLEAVKRDQKLFALKVEARGYKPVRFTFSNRSRLPILITLSTTSDTADSSIRAITGDEQSATYDLFCAPMVPPDATSIGIR